jgi:hypothetical protein
VNAGDEFGDGSRLVALWLVGGGELEVHLCRIKAGSREQGVGRRMRGFFAALRMTNFICGGGE